MKIRTLIHENPASKQNNIEKMIVELREKDSNSIKSDILEILNDESLKIGSREKEIAFELVEKTQTIEAIPTLYKLLKTPVLSGIGGRVHDPTNAMIAIGKKGLPELLRVLKAEDEKSIPYQVISSILYHWFDHNKTSLRDFLMNKMDESDSKDQSKFRLLLGVVESWKSV